MRLAIVIARRHRRSREFGWMVIAFQSSDYLGLINLDGTVAAPRPYPGPTGPGGTDRMPAVNDVGDPCAGNRTHRFDGRELETEHPGHGHGKERPGGKPPRATGAPRPTARNGHRASSRPYTKVDLVVTHGR
jgi:hypothetical protein